MIYRLRGVISLYDGGVCWHGIPVDTVDVIEVTALIPANSPRAALQAVISAAAAAFYHRHCVAFDVTITDGDGREERLRR